MSESTAHDNHPGTGDRLQAGVRRGRQPPPEEDLWSDSYSPKELLAPFLALDVLVFLSVLAVYCLSNAWKAWLAVLLGGVVLYGALGLWLAYQRLSLRYRLTTFRLFHERGLLGRVTDRIEVIDIDDVTVEQGLVERMLGIGTLAIHSSDRTNPMLRLRGIDQIKQVADLIDGACRAERRRRAIHIESI
ncbi:MAG: PH domain-containing protein [Pirellulales bacterium]|nr:PH domain-containing protein [Pirellulales bacterium]